MRERAAKNANFDILAYVRKRIGQAIETDKQKKLLNEFAGAKTDKKGWF